MAVDTGFRTHARAHARIHACTQPYTHAHAAHTRAHLHVGYKRPVSPVKGEARYRLALDEVVLAARAGKAAEGPQRVHLELLRQWHALLHDERPVPVGPTAVDGLPNDGVREAVHLAKVLQVLPKGKGGIKPSACALLLQRWALWIQRWVVLWLR